MAELTRPVMKNWYQARGPSMTHMQKSANAMLLAYNTVYNNILEELMNGEKQFGSSTLFKVVGSNTFPSQTL